MSIGYTERMQVADWLKVAALWALVATALYLGGKLVAAIDDLRAEHARGAANLVQVGTDLNELLDRIATSVAQGDPTDVDIAAAKALADGLASTGVTIDAILAAPAPDPVPEPEPAPEPTPEP